MGDMLSKIGDSKSFIEKLAGKIPGYSGYKAKEDRRAADKLLRETLAARYEEQWKRISEIQKRMVQEMMIDHVALVESAALKLRTFIDTMKTAAYGYAGFFDEVKVKEGELDKLYQYDQALLEGVSKVASAVDNLESSLNTDGLPAAIRNVTVVCGECVTAFDRRKDVILS